MFSASLRFFFWPVYACPVPAGFLVAPACLCSGMFLLSACFGMFDFLACLSTFFFRPAAFHTSAAATSAAYRPQPSTSPPYDFCELQTLMLRNLDQVQLRDVDLRCPDSPLANHLRQRFYEMLQCNVKLGKRMLSEFCADKSTSTYYLHVLVSSDGQRLTLRAKLLYDPVYLCVPVVEDGKVCPWNKPAFAEICDAIQHASV